MKEILRNKNQLEMARVVDPRNIPFKNKKFDEFIEEGIDFNKKSMTVWFTPTDERYVDTSLENNPTMDKEIMTDVEVWSIFRHAKDGNKDDGNPLIYALKGDGNFVKNQTVRQLKNNLN